MVKPKQQFAVSSRRAVRWESKSQVFAQDWQGQPFVTFREQEEHEKIFGLISVNTVHTKTGRISSLRSRMTKLSNADIDTQTAKLRDEWNRDI